jgi:hypothetical protein
MPISHRQDRGRRTAAMAAAWFRDHGWPYAANKTGAAAGQDIDNMPGLSPEVKATAGGGDLTGALRQARRNAAPGVLPFVVWRPNGRGPERIGEWVVAFTLADATDLLRDAGYGTPITTDEQDGAA